MNAIIDAIKAAIEILGKVIDRAGKLGAPVSDKEFSEEIERIKKAVEDAEKQGWDVVKSGPKK